MAHIDNLVAAIPDEDLRRALQAAVRKLTGGRQFGLVFNEHNPESVLLYKQQSVRRGSKVMVMRDGTADRTDTDETGVWVVTALSAGTASLAHRSDRTMVREAPRDRCVVVREFGDPVYPGLASTDRVVRNPDRPFHTLINSENFHALQALLYPYSGKIDAIYIDPPYNSGARDWKYNNDYVDDGDRHSKWLAMMDKRLRAAKQLLNPTNSVLILAIDENEVHRIALLLEQIFVGSKLQMVTVLINPAGASIADQFSRVDEHLLFVHIGSAQPARTETDTTPGLSSFVSVGGTAKTFAWEPFQRSGGNSRRQDTKAKFFPVWIHAETGQVVGCGEHLPLGSDRSEAPAPPEGCIAQWPIKRDGSEACWQLSAATFRKYLNEGRIRVGARNKTSGRWGISFLTGGHMAAIERGELVIDGRDSAGALIVKNAEGRLRTQVGKTMWTNGAYSATEHGSTLLKKFLPRRSFPYPKSLYAVEDALRYYLIDKPDALVLDFFAGSGTTAHAVMRLNHQDGGRRQSISVTNNDVSESEAETLRARGIYPGADEWEALGICEYITKPRLRAAVTGITHEDHPVVGDYRFVDPFPMADGFNENIEFFELTYEDPNLVSLGRKFTAIAPLLWMVAGARGERVDAIDPAGWAIPDDSNYGVLFEPAHWSNFVERVNQRATSGSPLTHAFVVTDSGSEYRQIVSKLPPGVQAQQLYRDYLRNFEINTRLPA
ncbi:site-specific DNA-methyltransferase [Microbacterium sp. p3-SID337]|uniref:site-specific DNA-methyltransferase n=1 Tax=Microbacterium sp. p3-SID337 TaxID=2916213 RepID=UPI0021A650E9|nr:DNA methyltransferase [Microbacterium sp. p3-SID337]MCT1377770.1 site-specific DNA-methyltransferase [Microbacterium sp. p3-SID337]